METSYKSCEVHELVYTYVLIVSYKSYTGTYYYCWLTVSPTIRLASSELMTVELSHQLTCSLERTFGTLHKAKGKSEHHIKNSQDFVNKVSGLKVDSEETITSYDVTALFTCIPPDGAVRVVQEYLEKEPPCRRGPSCLPHKYVNS